MIQLKMPLNKEEEISKSNGTAVDKQSSSSLFPSQSGSRKPYTDNYSSQNYTPRRDGIIYTDSGSVDDLDSRVEGGFITIDHWTVHATVLPIQLQVLIPKESDWLGPISDSCVEVHTVSILYLLLFLLFLFSSTLIISLSFFIPSFLFFSFLPFFLSFFIYLFIYCSPSIAVPIYFSLFLSLSSTLHLFLRLNLCLTLLVQRHSRED